MQRFLHRRVPHKAAQDGGRWLPATSLKKRAGSRSRYSVSVFMKRMMA
jgi:hypothetical protein